jgi:hypothetical protein
VCYLSTKSVLCRLKLSSSSMPSKATHKKIKNGKCKKKNKKHCVIGYHRLQKHRYHLPHLHHQTHQLHHHHHRSTDTHKKQLSLKLFKQVEQQNNIEYILQFLQDKPLQLLSIQLPMNATIDAHKSHYFNNKPSNLQTIQVLVFLVFQKYVECENENSYDSEQKNMCTSFSSTMKIILETLKR